MPFITETIETIEKTDLKEVIYSSQELGFDFSLGMLFLFLLVLIYIFRGFFFGLFSILFKVSLISIFCFYLYRMFFV